MPTLRLTLARATAWALLLAGWVGLGGIAFALTPSVLAVLALVALWLLALGLAAVVATRDALRARTRSGALALCAAITAAALMASTRGAGLPALLVALAGWAGMTALASGVVRSVRRAQPTLPAPPVGAATLGALAAALILADPGDGSGLSLRLALLVACAAVLLAWLQIADRAAGAPARCRAGLFDCSLPAWPAGAWQDAQQWPMLLAGLAMLPMMAALPLMVAWCRSEGLAPQGMVALHLAAMFAPALLLRGSIAHWPPRRLSLVCALLLAAGAAAALWLRAPLNLLVVAVLHGAAWSLAWTGQLWSPQRRGRQGASPLRAAAGYAAVTALVGWAVETHGPMGLVFSHAGLGGAAMAAWIYALARREQRAAAH